LRRDVVDHALSATTSNRSRRSLYSSANDAVVDDLLAMD
jgi:hypothetical protein